MPAQTIAKTFSRNRYPITLSCLGFSVLTFLVLYFMATPQWEAVGAIRLGQVPVLVDTIRLGEVAIRGAADARVEIAPVMSAVAVIEIMKQHSFLQDVLGAESNGFTASREPFRVRLLPSGNIEVKARASSRERAEQYLTDILKNLKSSHDKLFEQRIALVKNELQRIDGQLAANQMIQVRSTVLLGDALKGSPSLPDLLLLNILTQQAARIDRLADYSVRLKDSVNPLHSFPTNFVGRPDVSDQPVSPNRLLYSILSVFVGLLVGGALMLALHLRSEISSSSFQN